MSALAVLLVMAGCRSPIGSDDDEGLPARPPLSDVTATAFAVAPLGLAESSIVFGDYDGHPDILMTGRDAEGNPHTVLYRNQGDGTFTDVTSTLFPVGPPGLAESSVLFVDYNTDFRPDILMTGRAADDNPRTLLYGQQENGAFVEATTAVFAGAPAALAESSVAAVDYDADGIPDILMTGRDIGGNPQTILYRDQGDGTFADVTATAFDVVPPGLAESSAAIGGGDANGVVYLLITGRDAGGIPRTLLYRTSSGQ